jgi:hypothetical protein
VLPPHPCFKRLAGCRAGLKACSDNLNTRHRNAQLAGRASVELHTLIFFNKRTVVADARVTRVSARADMCDIIAKLWRNILRWSCFEAQLLTNSSAAQVA